MLLRYNQNFWQFRITRQRESFIILNNVRLVIHTQTCTQVQLFTPSACCFTFWIVLHNGKRHFLNINNKNRVSYCCYKRSDGGKKNSPFLPLFAVRRESENYSPLNKTPLEWLTGEWIVTVFSDITYHSLRSGFLIKCIRRMQRIIRQTANTR